MISSRYVLHNNPSHIVFKTCKHFQHISIKQKLMAPIQSAKKRKLSIDSLKTIKGQHYNDTNCNICKVSFPSNYQAQEHIVSTRHLKKMLEFHSNSYQNECIYCNVQFAGDHVTKTNHLSSIEHNNITKQILKQLTPNPHKSDTNSVHCTDTKHIHVKGIKNKHYTDGYCYVCDKSMTNNPHNLMHHLNGAKHIKNVLASYSANYEHKCIFCNALCNTAELKHSHISSENHTGFINAMIEETQSKYTHNNEWIISLDECKKKIANQNSNGITLNTKKKKKCKVIPKETASAGKIRKAIKDCYNSVNCVQSIEQQLNLLEKLYHRSSAVLNEKDYISILFCVSSLMRTNDINIISNGLIQICKLFSDNMETLEHSKWKMNHKLFEQIIDIIILSVNIKQLMRDFDDLIQQNMDSRAAFNYLLGIDAEKKFLEPFSFLFEVFDDISKWNDNSFENEHAHKYFMKWSQLIFKDMIYNLRDIRYCQQTDFDLHYKLLIKKLYHNMDALLPIDIHNANELRKYCCFTDIKRIECGPFTNITMSTSLECSLSALSKGTFVILFPENMQTNVIENKQCTVGHIYKTSPMSQTVTLRISDHNQNIQSDCKWHLLSMGASAISFERQFEALQTITSGSVSSQLRSILYNNDCNTLDCTNTNTELIETDLLLQLNESQQNAVKAALSDKNNDNITLIQGPPGTGKTHVAAAIVEQFLKSHPQLSSKILLSAYSNIAVDVLTQRISSIDNLYPLRIGQDSTLNTDSGVLLNTYPVWEWQNKINHSQIICATSIGTANDMLKNIQFDLILIDETTQSTECGLLVALSKLKPNGRIVLIGDHKQLPPTVLSTNAKYNGMNISLYERLIKHKNITPNFLNTQYRMHPKLAEFPSKYFYDGQLLTGIHEHERQIPYGFDWPIRGFPIAFVQTDVNAKESYSYTSTMNEREAEIVCDIVFRLVVNNNDNNITVISPYSAQKKLIDDNVYKMLSYEERKRVKVRTVDGFQGSECDIIVFSATRSNDNSIVGFLKDYRRINVMLTRPKNGLIVIGDRNTLENGDMLWRNWLTYVCDDNKAIVTHYT